MILGSEQDKALYYKRVSEDVSRMVVDAREQGEVKFKENIAKYFTQMAKKEEDIQLLNYKMMLTSKVSDVRKNGKIHFWLSIMKFSFHFNS